MRRVLYAGGSFDTGDEVAASVFEYARELARNVTADTVFVPARTSGGDVGIVEMLLGPTSQLLSEPLTMAGPEIVDEALVARVRALARRLATRRPGPEHPYIEGVADGMG